MYGHGGSDQFIGGNGADAISYHSATGDVRINILKSTADGNHANGDTFSSIENLTGGNYNDSLIGDHGVNVIYGKSGADTIYGHGGDDILNGEQWGDFLYGNSGDDVIDGGADYDVLYGGGGADIFVFGIDYGQDGIADFQDGIDKIDLTAYNFTDFADAFSNFFDNGDAVFAFGNDALFIANLSLSDVTADDLLI